MVRIAACCVVFGLSMLLLSGPAFCASVGSLPTGRYMANVSGLGEVCTPAGPATSFPDFVFSGGQYAYVVFGGDYDQLNWAGWTTDVKHYAICRDNATPWFGIWVAGLGDMNDDGDNDVLIGDTRHQNFRDWDENYGICYALYDIAEPMAAGRTELDLDDPGNSAVVAKITTDQVQTLFACCSQIVGDVDGDDYADLLIGESGWSPMGVEARQERYACGRACLFFGSEEFSDTGTTSASVVLLTGEDRNDHLGAAVSTVGYMGDDPMALDQYADFAVGAPWFDKLVGETWTENAGRVYVFFGDDSMTATHATDANIIITGETADSFFGSAIGSGDFDGDGAGDLVVGACGYDNQKGRAYVFFADSLLSDGDGLIDAADADVTIDGLEALDLFGNAVSTAGKFFGQMVEEDALIVGAPGVEDKKGAFYVFDMSSASSSMTAEDADYQITGLDEGDEVGLSVTNLGKVDADLDSDVGVVASGELLIHDEGN